MCDEKSGVEKRREKRDHTKDVLKNVGVDNIFSLNTTKKLQHKSN